MKTITSALSICLVSAILFVLSTGCSHNNPASLGPPSSYKVKTGTYYHPNPGFTDTFRYTYDGLGRILSTDGITYTYTGSQLDIIINTTYVIRCTLNTNGLLTSATFNDSLNNYSSYHIDYIYDAASFLIREDIYQGSGDFHQLTLQWVDSCLSRVYWDSTCVNQFTYYDIRDYRDNQIAYFADYALNGINEGLNLRGIQFWGPTVMGSMLGNHGTKLLRTFTNPNYHFSSYVYDFDQYGRVITQNETTGAGGGGGVGFKYTFTYY